VGFEGSTAKTSSRDCFFRGDDDNPQRDVAYYPEQDFYGNNLDTGYKPMTRYPTGHAYAGHIRIDNYTTQMNAAINALDHAAQRIRNRELHNGINTVTYVIGLGAAEEEQHELLRRVANDPDSTIFDSAALEGMYVYAPDAADLNLAFVRIASEILRYAQ
jgi:hypothetical protein